MAGLSVNKLPSARTTTAQVTTKTDSTRTS
jgi:hypothetical protein